MPKKAKKPRRTTGPSRPGRGRIPPDAETDLAKISKAFSEVDTEFAVLLSDDPALGLTDAHVTAVASSQVGGGRALPVAMFEPRKMIGQTLPDGTARELHRRVARLVFQDALRLLGDRQHVVGIRGIDRVVAPRDRHRVVDAGQRDRVVAGGQA